MKTTTDRRAFLQTSAACVGVFATSAICAHGVANQPTDTKSPTPESSWPGFPQQDPALAREIVGVSHRNLARVKELLTAHPALAKASYDWGFGDWESALGAASHVGNRDIANLLLENGARLDIFAATMLGMTDTVAAMLKAMPELAKTRGPHGISLVAHATAGDNAELAELLKTFPGADDDAKMPLTPEEMKPYLGNFQRDNGDPISVTQTKFGMAVKGGDGGERRLIRTGDHTFHPAGAPNVKVTFTVNQNAATRIEIVEATWLVSAIRKT